MPDSPFRNLMPLLQLKQQREQNEQALSLHKLSNEIETYKSQMTALQGMKEDRQTKLDGLQEERADRLEKLQVLGVAFERIKKDKEINDVGGDSFKIGGITLDRYSKEFNSIEKEIESTKADMEKMEVLTNYFNKGQQTSLENYNTILGADKKLTDDDFGTALKLYKENHPEEIDEKTGKLKEEQAVKRGISQALIEREDQLSNIDYKKALKGQANRVARGTKEADPIKAKISFFENEEDNTRLELGTVMDKKGVIQGENKSRFTELKAKQQWITEAKSNLLQGKDYTTTFEEFRLNNLYFDFINQFGEEQAGEMIKKTKMFRNYGK